MLFPKVIVVLLGTAAQGDFHQTSFEISHAASHCKINLGGGTKPLGIKDVIDGVMQVVSFVPEIGPVIGEVYSYGSKIYEFLDGVVSPKKDKIIDIWDCIRADVELLVDEKIAAEAFDEATQTLIGITDSLEVYRCMFYHWAHNTTDPCPQELHGAYGIGDQAWALFNLLQQDLPQFGLIAQQKALLPYYVFVATLHFSIAADILTYGDEWKMEPYVQSTVRDISLERLRTSSAHVMEVLNSKYIGTCVDAGYDACSVIYRETMDGSLRLVPTWPVLASSGLFNRSGVVIHNSHHMMSGRPGQDYFAHSAVIGKDMISGLLFDESRIYEQTICTSPDYLEFGHNDYLGWDGGFGGGQSVFSTGNLQWTFGKDPELCRGNYMYTIDPQCTGCSRTQFSVSPWHRLDKRVGGGRLDVLGTPFTVLHNDRGEYSYPVMIGFDCPEGTGYPCNYNLIDPDKLPYLKFAFYDQFIIPDNYQIYNIHPTCPNNTDIGDLMHNSGNWILLEYAPVQKTFDSLVVNGTTHVIPGASPNMEWAPNTDFEHAGYNEYLFGGHAAYSIGDGGSYYNINTPPGEPVEKLTVGAFILDETAHYSANIMYETSMHESRTLNIQLDKTNITMTGVQGQYTLYVSGVNSIPSAIKKIAITGTRGSLLGAIILSNDIEST
ncbi:hypothetical protein BGZ74_001211 [Mortierella antarctica]|nr:hypothetical protein BGZ74_001211 [Mortierella antarctica]